MSCPHSGYLTPDTCSICLHGPVVVDPMPTVRSTFMAKYPGQCKVCNLAIYVGQVVHGLSDASYVHAACHEARKNP